MQVAEDMRIGISTLCSTAKVEPRTIRYYISEGLLDRPYGSKRGAYYSLDHLLRLRQIRELREEGWPLEHIRERLSAKEQPEKPQSRPVGSVNVLTNVVLGEGIELTIDPERAKLSTGETKKLYEALRETYRKTTHKGDNNDNKMA